MAIIMLTVFYNDNAVGLLVLVITKMMMAIMNMIMMIM